MHMTWVCPLSTESPFSQFCGVLAIKPCWPSKVNALGALSSGARPHRCGAWLGALNSDSCRRTSAIYYSPVCGHVPGGSGERSGMWLYCKHTPATISLWVLLYVFGCWLSFLFVCLSPVFLISGCSAVSWDFSVLMKGGELEVIPLHHFVQEAVAWHLIIKQMKNFIKTICSAIPIFGNIFLFFFPKGSYFSPKCCWECSLLWLFWNFAGI